MSHIDSSWHTPFRRKTILLVTALIATMLLVVYFVYPEGLTSSGIVGGAPVEYAPAE